MKQKSFTKSGPQVLSSSFKWVSWYLQIRWSHSGRNYTWTVFLDLLYKQQKVTHSDLFSQKKGLFMAMFFSSCRVSVSVALNSSVCRLAGKIPIMVSRSLVKSVQPCSNSRSASSIIWRTHKDEIKMMTLIKNPQTWQNYSLVFKH